MLSTTLIKLRSYICYVKSHPYTIKMLHIQGLYVLMIINWLQLAKADNL